MFLPYVGCIAIRRAGEGVGIVGCLHLDERIDLAHAGGINIFFWSTTLDAFVGVLEVPPVHVVLTEHTEAGFRRPNFTR